MFQEKRPTSVTVIGGAWIFIGALMSLASAFALVVAHLQPALAGSTNPYAFRHLPEFAVAEIFVGMLGVVAAVNFLRFREWARVVLAGLSLVSFVGVLVFAIFFIFTFRAIAHGEPSTGFDVLFQFWALIACAIYAVPLGLMFWHLQGKKVREAMDAGNGSRCQ